MSASSVTQSPPKQLPMFGVPRKVDGKLRVTVFCAWCGEAKLLPPSAVNDRNFCNRICSGKWHSRFMQGTNNPNYGKRGENSPAWRGVKVFCGECGTPKVMSRSRANSSTRHFCNNTCRAAWVRENQKGENHPNYGKRGLRGEKHPLWRGVKVNCAADGCNGSKIVSASKVREHNFCNRACQSKWQSENTSGHNSPRWRGGPRSYPPEWTESLKLAVRERDNYHCAHCGRDCLYDERQPDVHHLDNRKSNCDMSNLVTLCVSCHASVSAAWYDEEKWFYFQRLFAQYIFEVSTVLK